MGILETIVRYKLEEIAAAKREPALRQERPNRPSRDFVAALRNPGLSIIAEIKRQSPSCGELRADLDPAALAREYCRCGAAAISCLTDQCFFGAQSDDLTLAAAAVQVPVLRKDFIIDEFQIRE